ncbi:S41 family peptidase [Streptomyces sp. bgisy100]|uniref:S41 family peptidase n=1 Tax=Streptomyces sp. bgisy100 TaxID=3413783 RepID=UPI003D733628
MEKHSLVRHEVDWADVRSRGFSRARGARKPADTYGAIHSALRSLGDGHSYFRTPEQAEAKLRSSPASFRGLRGRSLKGGIGYVSLPGAEGSQKAYDRYVQQGREAVAAADRSGACGWVVDLRANDGGSLWPMLAVVGPVLGDGTAGMFVDADGDRSAWSIKHGTPYRDGKPAGWGDSRPLARSTPPVAVLTGSRTASAAEAVVVSFRGRPHTRSFGERTNGVPSANKRYGLSDGAVLTLTIAKAADRTGRTYDGAIPPDEEIPENQEAAARGRDNAALKAARSWLLEQAACRRR